MSAVALVALVVACALPCSADDPRPAALREVGIDQRLDTQLPLDVALRDESGAEVRLGAYFGDRPVVLAFVYYECPMLCTLVLNGLVSSLRTLAFDAGNQFDVVVVSFDAADTPEKAAAKKAGVLEKYRRAGAEKGWHFLTGDAGAIRRLTESAGFRYKRDEPSGEFAHASAILVVTPRGRIARYLYGVEYPPRDLRLALVEAAENRIGSAVDQLLLFCYRYDPHTGRYSAAVLNLVRLAGGLTAFGLMAFMIVQWRRDASAAPGGEAARRERGIGVRPR